MAKFLNTSATTHYLDQMMQQTREQLIIISPFLQFNDRIKELLADLDRMKIDMRIVYGKSELAPQESNWLRTLGSVRIYFCKNLHAKCYMNEQEAIITSMNLYEFSQVNNNEMGVYFKKDDEPELYRETSEEARRLIRIAESVPLTAEKIEDPEEDESNAPAKGDGKLTTSNLAKKFGISTTVLTDRLVAKGFLTRNGEQLMLTDAGKAAGGEIRLSKKFGPFFLWPDDIDTDLAKSSTNERARTQPPGILRTIANTLKVAIVGGKCIRCERAIDYDPDKPLCADCFKMWNRFKDRNYKERYCHQCGQAFATTLAHPLCDSCSKQ